MVYVSLTTEDANHQHVARTNRRGDGQTVQDDTGHIHRIVGYSVLTVNNHNHQIIEESITPAAQS